MAKRYRRSISPFTNYGRAIGTAMKYGYKAYRSYKKYQKAKLQNQNTTTSQYDTKLQYKKKRRPRRQRKAWASFAKKVTAVQLKNSGTFTRVFNSQLSRVVPVSDQTIFGCHLYSKAGKLFNPIVLDEAGLSDLFRIVQAEGNLDSFKLHFDTAVLDLTYRNKGNTGHEVDLYVVSYNEDTIDNSFQSAVNTAQNETETLGNATASLTLAQRGTTLFDFPLLISALKMKIWSKRKYFVPAGQTFTYQYRDSKNHEVNAINVRDGLTDEQINLNGAGFVYPKLTKGIVLVVKNLPESGGVGDAAIGVTRKYKYTIMEKNKAFDGFNDNI